MSSITLNAPAKINLYLDVTSKRSDGYHNISTIFQKLALYDKIRVRTIDGKGISLNCKYPHIPQGRENLAYKSAELLLNEYNISSGVKIDIIKNIPTAAGLGGGSSDAASVMLAMDRLFNLNIPSKKLISLAKTIGADVPFFVSGHKCALGKGIGDRLSEIKSNQSFYILLILPNLRIYTKTIYSKISFPLTKPPANVNIISRILAGSTDINTVYKSIFNRLEEVVLPIYPRVRKVKEMLSLHTKGALLSGSGPTIFGLFSKRKEAMRARDRIQDSGNWRLLLTKTA
ncbi:4-(cytidine 5'-diphospho)-2-C-methyl-D-erythritol kinase [Candidatus Omnitrophota bacterium]